MTIGNQTFCLFLYLTGVHFRGELQHIGDVSQQKSHIGFTLVTHGVTLSDVLHAGYKKIAVIVIWVNFPSTLMKYVPSHS